MARKASIAAADRIIPGPPLRRRSSALRRRARPGRARGRCGTGGARSSCPIRCPACRARRATPTSAGLPNSPALSIAALHFVCRSRSTPEPARKAAHVARVHPPEPGEPGDQEARLALPGALVRVDDTFRARCSAPRPALRLRQRQQGPALAAFARPGRPTRIALRSRPAASIEAMIGAASSASSLSTGSRAAA